MKYKIGDKFDLKENSKRIISKKEVNGYGNQEFESEEVEWVVFNIDEEKGEMLLISKEPIKQKVYFQGKEGYDNGIEELNRLCREITGVEEARSLTFEDIINSKYYEKEDKAQTKLIFGDKEKEFEYWLGSSFVYAGSSGARFGLRLVNNSYVGGYYFFLSLGSYSDDGYGLRPAISISL